MKYIQQKYVFETEKQKAEEITAQSQVTVGPYTPFNQTLRVIIVVIPTVNLLSYNSTDISSLKCDFIDEIIHETTA